MSELSVRETAARAIKARRGVPERDHRECGEACAYVMDADAVLAAVADHDGLADVLAQCAPRASGLNGLICVTHGPIGRRVAWSDHLADVVRAWLRDPS